MNVDNIKSNPFSAASTLPYQAPPFDRISEDDFLPAIMEGMRLHAVEVENIITDPDAPTFENTLVALERSGEMLNRVLPVFSAITGANTSDMLQQVQQTVAPLLSAHEDSIYLDSRLFHRVEAVYEQRHIIDLDAESLKLVEWYYDDFVCRGARLSDSDKATLRELNKQASTLETTFTNRLLAATKAAALVLDDPAALAGMSDGELAASARAATERRLADAWIIPLQNTTQQPALQSLANRETRERLFNASWNRTERGDANDTRGTIARIAQIRAERARLLGFPSYAAMALKDQMARTPENALRFVHDLVPAAVANARAEAEAIQATIDNHGNAFQLQPWDWPHYAERVRRARYDLDEEMLRQYFELNNVLQKGVFYAATQLYGITFRERSDIPVYHPDVRVFEVFDADGSPLTLFYCDYFERDNKNGGAWMDCLIAQSKLLGTRPVIYNVANFPKPASGKSALISFDDVITMFHEFGHALHGLFADQQYPSLSGTSVARDFVELPSQFNEHWATEPSILANYAMHHESGQPLDQAVADRIRQAEKFNQGYRLTEVLAAALLDMSWHTLPADAPVQDVDKFEAESLEQNQANLPMVPPRYRSSYFMHIWSNGYSAGYYAYLWAEMLDADAYEWFTEHGGLSRANGDHFRRTILSRGNTMDLAAMYREFRGRDAHLAPMLAGRGLSAELVQ